MSLGYQTTASGAFSNAMGWGTNASGRISTALGCSSIASGWGATAMGTNTQAIGVSSTAIGRQTMASGDHSTAMGLYTIASGDVSTAIGESNKATGLCSTATGVFTSAKGSYSFSSGLGSSSQSVASATFGRYNVISGDSLNWISTDPLFVIGNGTYTAPSNAMTVLKNGNTAIGGANPTQMLDVNGNARFRGVSSGTFGNNLNIMADGTLTTATSDISMKENIYQITDALDRVIKMRGVFFNWKSDSTKTKQIGMIAQEVEPIVPEIVFTNPVDGLKGINYSQASALLVEAIKAQQQQIEGQQQIIEKQQVEINHLKTLENEVSELKFLVNTLVANQNVQGNK
jgi:hypothetical protein